MLPPKPLLLRSFGQLALRVMGRCWPEILIEIFWYGLSMTRNSYVSSQWSHQLDKVISRVGSLATKNSLKSLLCFYFFSLYDHFGSGMNIINANKKLEKSNVNWHSYNILGVFKIRPRLITNLGSKFIRPSASSKIWPDTLFGLGLDHISNWPNPSQSQNIFFINYIF